MTTPTPTATVPHEDLDGIPEQGTKDPFFPRIAGQKYLVSPQRLSYSEWKGKDGSKHRGYFALVAVLTSTCDLVPVGRDHVILFESTDGKRQEKELARMVAFMRCSLGKPADFKANETRAKWLALGEDLAAEGLTCEVQTYGRDGQVFDKTQNKMVPATFVNQDYFVAIL